MMKLLMKLYIELKDKEFKKERILMRYLKLD